MSDKNVWWLYDSDVMESIRTVFWGYYADYELPREVLSDISPEKFYMMEQLWAMREGLA